MSQSIIINLDNPSNFIFDSNKIEMLTSGKFKNLTPTDATFVATYTNNINGNYGNGVLTGTPTGGAVIVGNRLDLTGDITKYVDYDANNNADSQQTGTFLTKLTPNYSGPPSSNKAIFCTTRINGSSDNMIQLLHLTSGVLLLQMRDQNGNLILTYSMPVWSPIAGQRYEFSLNFDLTAGETRLFIEGNQHGVTQTATGIRSSDINLLRIGNNNQGSYTSDMYIEDFVYFSTVQHTANYTPGYTLSETLYDTTNPVIELNTAIITIKADQLFNMLENVSKPVNDDITYVLSRNGSSVYYNIVNGQWETSDLSPTKSNTIAEMLQGKESFLTDGDGKTIGIYWVMHSNDGSTTPEAISITLEYDFTVDVPTLIENIVYGSVYDMNSNINRNPIKITPFSYVINTNTIVTNKGILVIPFENGTFEAKIYTEDVNPDGLIWEFEDFTIRTNFLSGINKFSDLTIVS